MRSAFLTSFPLPFIRRLGRAGSAVCIAVAVFFAYGAQWCWAIGGPSNDTEIASEQLVGLAVFLLGAAVLVTIQGVALVIRGAPPAPRRLGDAEVRERLQSGERPLTVCLDCRSFTVVPPCDRCGQSSSCLEILSPQDVANALSLMSLDQPALAHGPTSGFLL